MELGHIGAEWNRYLIERDTLGKQLKDCADKEQKMVDVIIALELSWMSVTVCYGNGRFLQIFCCLLWEQSYTAIKVWPHYQVVLVMTRGRSHMERSVTKFSLPSITGNPSPNLVPLPSFTGRITSN